MQMETRDEGSSDLPLAERIAAFEQGLKDLRERLGLELSPQIDFPIYKQLPPEVQLALEVIKKHGGVYVTSYIDRKQG